MREWEFEGKTVQEAIENGLRELGLAREDVDVKVLSEGKTGLFGLMGASPAKIKIFSRKAAAEKPSEKSKDRAGTPSTINPELQTRATAELKKILRYMKLDATVNSRSVDDHIFLDVISKDSALIIGKHGNTINALQLILNMILKHTAPEMPGVVVDTSGYRVRRQRMLERLAEDAVKNAVSTGAPVPLQPMNSSERRLIHTYLKDNPDVTTASEGEGAARKLVVSPKKPKT